MLKFKDQKHSKGCLFFLKEWLSDERNLSNPNLISLLIVHEKYLVWVGIFGLTYWEQPHTFLHTSKLPFQTILLFYIPKNWSAIKLIHPFIYRTITFDHNEKTINLETEKISSFFYKTIKVVCCCVQDRDCISNW